MLAVYLLVSPASMVQVAVSACVLAAMVGVAHLPSRPRRIVTAMAFAVLGAGVGVALAVPYHCDPVWKYFGWC